MTNDNLCEPLVEVLKADRERLNQQFAQRRLAGIQIEGPEFLRHLATVIDPIVRGVAERFPERVRSSVGGLFDVSLELFAARLLGPSPRIPEVAALWRTVLPTACLLLARDPERLAGALSNAVYHLAAHPGGRPEDWLKQMELAARHADDVDDFLRVGQVLAWKSGMAQYRTAALQIVSTLPTRLRALVLDRDLETPAADLAATLEQLSNDPWMRTDQSAGDGTSAIQLVCVVGGFRGLGGQFLRPPTVGPLDGKICIHDGEATWQLSADAFGSHLQRLPPTRLPKAHKTRSDVQVDPNGLVVWGSDRATLPQLVEPSSWTSDGTTLAVSLHSSHRVYLAART